MRVARSLALVFVLATTCLSASSSAWAVEPVRPADEFVDSIGVNVHMSYVDTAYADRHRLIDNLSAAGIRHVRDGLSWNAAAYNEMADRGIGTTFIMGDPTGRYGTLPQLLDDLKTKVPRAAEAVEGPNEYSASGNPNWVDDLRGYQARLFAGVKNDPALAHLPVLAPSIIHPEDHTLLGDMRSSIDFGNRHIYAGGDLPEGNVAQEMAVAARVSGDRPIYATEAGYHNALATDNGHRPASEEAVSTYLPRMYLEYFRRGIKRTFAYELIDQLPDPGKTNAEASFGLLRNDYSKKPAFGRLERLIALLADPGPAHTARPLDYSIVNAPSDLHQLVLQKRDGSHYLVLWRAVRVWDPVSRRSIAPDTRSVRVAITEPGARYAEIVRPSESVTPVATAGLPGEVPLSIGADPIVIRVAGSTAPGASPPRARPRGRRRLSQAVVPSGQRLGQVKARGLLVRCSTYCTATGRRHGRRIVTGRSSLKATGSRTARLLLTREGRRLARRAVRQRRSLALVVRVRFSDAPTVTRRVGIRP